MDIYRNNVKNQEIKLFSNIKIDNIISDSNNVAAYIKFQRYLQIEIRDISSMLDSYKKYETIETELINQEKDLEYNKESYEKLLTGKYNLKTMFSFKNKNDTINHLDTEISEGKRKIEELKELLNSVSLVLAFNEVDEFWNDKGSRLLKMVKYLSEENRK